ncbi:hypothetical protein [Vibrio vulnificus YJ016]|uniref:Uncharacterized protein n=1 Tax=Vibrio vulnificus (strain YJ016) TaxID=196600 RepID=Q7MJW2_VIBVY|nr:hypothetical protein [Vibrio vulnificus YJ016]
MSTDKAQSEKAKIFGRHLSAIRIWDKTRCPPTLKINKAAIER